MPSYATQILRAFFPNILFVKPAYEFCSCNNVGTFAFSAALSKGPLAYPPTPIAISGLNFFTILRAIAALLSSIKGNFKFLNVSFRCNPIIGSPTISKPASGTFVISILPNAPTKRNLVLGLNFFIAFAIAMAGKICPPVPPPEIITFNLPIFHLRFFIFSITTYT